MSTTNHTPTELPEDINKVPKAASQPIGAVWVKGEYDRLYDQVKWGKRTVCFVDYRYGHVDQEQVCRDICTIDNEGWEFFARGIGYGRLSYAMKKYGMAQDSAFVKICEEMNVEWLDESPTAAGDGKEDAVAFIAAVIEEGAEMWKMEYDSCRKILEELVDLKDIKDREGKTDDYLMRQPVAWVRAKRFLEKYQHINW